MIVGSVYDEVTVVGSKFAMATVVGSEYDEDETTLIGSEYDMVIAVGSIFAVTTAVGMEYDETRFVGNEYDETAVVGMEEYVKISALDDEDTAVAIVGTSAQVIDMIHTTSIAAKNDFVLMI